MHTATLTATLDLGDFGGAELFFADINRDGKPEIVAYQGPGVFGASMFAGLDRIKPWLPRNACVSAFDLTGRRLWTWGEPNQADRPYVSHAFESCLSLGDADNDGETEIAVALGHAVVLLDARTGRVKQSTALPEDYYYVVHILGLPTTNREAALVLKNSETDYAGGPYGQPVIGLNASLQPVWGPVVIPGAGHLVLSIPPTGKGEGAYLLGYCAIRADGRREWTVDAIDVDHLDAEKQHVDYAVAWHDENRRLRFAIAGSDRGYWVEDGGRTCFTVTEGHVQSVAVGRFNGHRQQLAFYNAPGGPVALYDLEGRRRWRAETPRVDEEMRPLSLVPGCAFHRNLPITTVPGADRDWIAYADGGWPWGLDGTGARALTFPPPAPGNRVDWREAQLHANQRRLDDMGYGYAIKSMPASGATPPLTAIYNRRYVWLYAV